MRPDIKEVFEEITLITEKIEKDDKNTSRTVRKCTIM
jgi:hypothetical protein